MKTPQTPEEIKHLDSDRMLFVRLKYEIGQLMADKFLEYNEGKFHTGIELNPATHAITEFVFEKIKQMSESRKIMIQQAVRVALEDAADQVKSSRGSQCILSRESEILKKLGI